MCHHTNPTLQLQNFALLGQWPAWWKGSLWIARFPSVTERRNGQLAAVCHVLAEQPREHNRLVRAAFLKSGKKWVICIRFLERNYFTSFCMKKGSAFLKILLSQLRDECWGGLRLLCHEACSGFSDSRWPSPLKGSNFAGSCNARSIRRFSVRFFVFELSWLLPQLWTKQRIRGLICKLLR